MVYDVAQFASLIAPLSAVGALGLVAKLDDAIDWLFFDLYHGVKTCGPAPASQCVNVGDEAGELYVPTPVRTVRSILTALSVNREEFTFIDLGSGKGRVLMIASEFGYGRIIGVEHSPELVDISHRNFDCYRKPELMQQSIETVCMDAGDYEYPDGPLVLYLFNPFPSSIMKRVAANLARAYEAAPRPVYLIYCHPRCGDVISALPFFRRISLHGANTDYFCVFGASLDDSR